MKSSLKRESLRFDGIKNEKDELENANAELKRSNVDLKRQVDKWQSLENKEGTEIEKLRKERITLEVKLREVETRLSESEQHHAEELGLKEARVEKFRARLQDYVVRFNFRPHLPSSLEPRAFSSLLERRQGLPGVHRAARRDMRGAPTDCGHAQGEECKTQS